MRTKHMDGKSHIFAFSTQPHWHSTDYEESWKRFGWALKKELDQLGNWKISRLHRRSVESNINFVQHLGREFLCVFQSHTFKVTEDWVLCYESSANPGLLKIAADSSSIRRSIGNLGLESFFSSLQLLGTVNSHLQIWGHSLSTAMSSKLRLTL